MTTSIGIAGIGTYFPATIETAAEVEPQTGIPAKVLHEKMGIRQRHIAGEQDTISFMASEAAKRAIAQAGIDPAQINVVISHGSEYKDHLIWNAAAKIQQNVGAVNAYAFDMYALCAAAPIAMNIARGMMVADPSVQYVLLAAGSRENEIINLKNERTRFMFNFGAGAGAMVLKRDSTENRILGMSAFTDGTLSEAVMLSPDVVAEGAPQHVGDLVGRLDVVDPQYMTDRLGSTSMQNFMRVMREAAEKSGHTLADMNFLGITHMKRSFYLEILHALGLTEDNSVYLEDYGHVQSVDQAVAIQLGLEQGKIKNGDLLMLAGAGVGYTWSAAVVQWGQA
ncbi:MAG: ketoacyl-ACP synthase III [Anaerolineae bacterium]